MKSVLDEYNQHYNSIKEEKQKQQNALKTILEYLDNLRNDSNISKEDREMLKKDQENISKELSSIENELLEIS